MDSIAPGACTILAPDAMVAGILPMSGKGRRGCPPRGGRQVRMKHSGSSDRPAAAGAAGLAGLFRLDGRQSLVTGAAHGIGLATATLLAQAGSRVALVDLDQAALRDAEAKLTAAGHQISIHAADIVDEEAIARTVESVVAAAGAIDVLVNNAGIGARVPTETLDTATWERVLAVNLTGSFVCARIVGQGMLARGRGAVVNVASIMGMVGNGLYANAAYHATKGGLVNLTRALAVEWAPRGVRVNAVAPCFVETPLTQRLLSDREMAAAILERTPLGRLATPDDVAAAILFLACDASSMVTGHVLAVDGGWLAQ
jgi:NAD(P)-dependent dehydrogenase (short-subunit alcohol dehydrogenase family)